MHAAIYIHACMEPLTELPQCHGSYAVWHTLGGQNALKHFPGERVLTLEIVQVTHVELSCGEHVCVSVCVCVCVRERERVCVRVQVCI